MPASNRSTRTADRFRLDDLGDSSNVSGKAGNARLTSRFAAICILPACVLLIAGCQTGIPSDALSMRSDTAPTDVMLSIAKAAQTCWFKSGDRAFGGYRLANEVNSPAGRPRILLVPKSDPSALPLLVVQAETRGSTATGNYTDIQAYGPILATGNGKRITDDVKRWADGDDACQTG